MLFKIKQIDTWIHPHKIEAISHEDNSSGHTVTIDMDSGVVHVVTMTSHDDCRKFMTELFKAMGEVYTYE